MTPLILLVGFLGSGKTTYLRRLLPALQAQSLDPYVIINDYQNAKIDAALLGDITPSVIPISGSCVCCGSREELLTALETFEHRPKRIVLVETNGTTDSEELIELLSLEPALHRFTQPVQISVIDGQRWQRRFWHNALELEQAQTASFLFISRLDELDEKRTSAIEKSLEKHEITAPRVTPEEFALEAIAIVEAVQSLASRDVVAHPDDCACGHHHEEEEPHHEHDHGSHHFASLQISLPETVTRASLLHFLAELPEEVIRAKGLVRLTESPQEYHVFQKVERSVQLLPIGRESRLRHAVAVLIGPHIPEDRVRTLAAESFTAGV